MLPLMSRVKLYSLQLIRLIDRFDENFLFKIEKVFFFENQNKNLFRKKNQFEQIRFLFIERPLQLSQVRTLIRSINLHM